jgi:hypothetical protein
MKHEDDGAVPGQQIRQTLTERTRLIMQIWAVSTGIDMNERHIPDPTISCGWDVGATYEDMVTFALNLRDSVDETRPQE